RIIGPASRAGKKNEMSLTFRAALVMLNIRNLVGRCSYEAGDRPKADPNEGDGQGEANVTKTFASIFADRDAPLSGKQPNAVSEMPRHSHNADHVKSNRPHALEIEPHLGECGVVAAPP